MATPRTVLVNRAPVLTLWAAVVAETLGHDRSTALTLGKTLAGLNAQSKGRRLGIYPAPDEDAAAKKAKPRGKGKTVELMGRRLSLAAAKKEDPDAIELSLERKLGDALPATRAAMTALAKSMPPDELEARAYALYEKFRPTVPAGQRGWGAKGELDLALVRSLGKRGAPGGKKRSKRST